MTTVHNHIYNVLKSINHKWSTLHVEKAMQFNSNDWVLVDRRNLQVKAGNNKSLTHKCLGPYKVIKAIGSHAYPLEVPKGTRWHNVVHSTLLTPLRRQDKPQDIEEDEEEIWEVEEIVNSSRVKRVVQYQVWWTGCTELKDTWETFDHLNNCPEKLQEFQQKFFRKPRDEKDVWTLPNIWIFIHVDIAPFISFYCHIFPLGFFGKLDRLLIAMAYVYRHTDFVGLWYR